MEALLLLHTEPLAELCAGKSSTAKRASSKRGRHSRNCFLKSVVSTRNGQNSIATRDGYEVHTGLGEVVPHLLYTTIEQPPYNGHPGFIRTPLISDSNHLSSATMDAGPRKHRGGREHFPAIGRANDTRWHRLPITAQREGASTCSSSMHKLYGRSLICSPCSCKIR